MIVNLLLNAQDVGGDLIIPMVTPFNEMTKVHHALCPHIMFVSNKNGMAALQLHCFLSCVSL
jgi:hypothetical protein